MKLEQLQQHIRFLASLEEGEQPIVSCYVDLTEPKEERQKYLISRIDSIVRTWPNGTQRGHLVDALNSVVRQTSQNNEPETKSLAVFARGGASSFCLPLRFRLPLPTTLTVDRVPHLSPLVVMKDRYHRYVVLVTTSRSARILEVSLGAVTQQKSVERQEAKARVGREWTRLHYQNYRSEKKRQFIKEKIAVLERLMADEKYGHLILAGESDYVHEVRKALPKHLSMKLIDVLSLSSLSDRELVLKETLSAFMKAEENESLETVERLFNAFYRNDLAVLGSGDTFNAMLQERVDTLVIEADCNLGAVHVCKLCRWVSSADAQPEVCGVCGSSVLHKYDTREELIRLAEKKRCRIETVGRSEQLHRAGGVGCFLRYALTPDRVMWGGERETLA